MDCKAAIIEEIEQRIKKVGDLPLFSATVNRIRQISSDPDSNAMVLSKEITKDVGLTTTLLKLANSPYYNRGNKISVISRGIVLLGYETIMNLSLTLKLIESFQHEHPSNKLSRLLVNAFQAASFAKDLALRGGVKNIEEIYTCTLLHLVGEISVAYFLTDKYQQLMTTKQQSPDISEDLEREILGVTMTQIGQCLARNWEFPDTVVRTMEHYNPAKQQGRPKGAVQISRALASLSSQMISQMQHEHSDSLPYSDLLKYTADIIGITDEDVEASLSTSFKSSYELASLYGLDKDQLMPDLHSSQDEKRDRMANKLAYLNSELSPKAVMSSAPASAEVSPATITAVVSQEKLLDYIQEITTLITTSANLHQVFSLAIEGIKQSAGFDRAALCLISPDQQSYTARVLTGDNCEPLKDYFQQAVDPEHDLFSSVLLNGNEMIVQDVFNPSWTKSLKNDFAKTTQACCFITAGLHLNTKPIGFIYADRCQQGSAIAPEQHRCFSQILSQVRLALKMSAN